MSDIPPDLDMLEIPWTESELMTFNGYKVRDTVIPWLKARHHPTWRKIKNRWDCDQVDGLRDTSNLGIARAIFAFCREPDDGDGLRVHREAVAVTGLELGPNVGREVGPPIGQASVPMADVATPQGGFNHRGVVEWVAKNLWVKRVDPDAAPSTEALGMLHWARSDKSAQTKFWEIWAKLLPTKAQVESEADVDDDVVDRDRILALIASGRHAMSGNGES